jgi:hypothetical protein
MNGRASRDGKLRLLGVGKAYDDDLYAYGVGRFPEEFDDLKIKHIETETMEGFEVLLPCGLIPGGSIFPSQAGAQFSTLLRRSIACCI